MSVPDPAVRALYARLEEVLGSEHADTLMTRLPPPPDELARRADIDRLEQRFDHLEQRFDGFERRFERIDDRFDQMFEMMGRQWRNYTTVMVTAMTALTAIYGGMLIAFVA